MKITCPYCHKEFSVELIKAPDMVVGGVLCHYDAAVKAYKPYTGQELTEKLLERSCHTEQHYGQELFFQH